MANAWTTIFFFFLSSENRKTLQMTFTREIFKHNFMMSSKRASSTSLLPSQAPRCPRSQGSMSSLLYTLQERRSSNKWWQPWFQRLPAAPWSESGCIMVCCHNTFHQHSVHDGPKHKVIASATRTLPMFLSKAHSQAEESNDSLLYVQVTEETEWLWYRLAEP